MMLSRLVLNLRSREVRAALRDAHKLHALVMRGFPQALDPRAARHEFGVLHRLELDGPHGHPLLSVQSPVAPDWSALGDILATIDGRESLELRDLEADFEALKTGALCAFRLRANVTRKIDTTSREDGVRRNGRRVPLTDNDGRIAWLARKGQNGGFTLAQGLSDAPEVRITLEPLDRGQQGTARLTFDGVRFDGLLRVEDPMKLRATVSAGVGPAKAFGFGLLSVRAL
jgi:CRISPR system Cascade subunit CasE